MKKFNFKIAGNAYAVEIKSFENNVVKLDLNGSSFRIEVDEEKPTSKTPRIVRPPVAKAQGAHKIEKSPNAGMCKIDAPLPGVIVSISVSEGDAVTKGQKLLVYEAMKMENDIVAPQDGVISKLHMSVNDNVLQGDILITIE